ncbi:MAG: carbon starvation protein A [Candidatus Binatia bacterium]
MPAIVLVIVGLGLFYWAYRSYSKFLAEKIYRLDPNFKTPAHELEDGVEYIPTNKHILMGHHYVSVAGAAPIVGPAIAMIWGWVPAFLWVVIGSIFGSGAHDFGSIWVSARHKGRSIGDLTSSLISERTRLVFLIVIYFLVLMVNAVFALVISFLFIKYSTSVIPVFVEIPLALVIGWLIYKYRRGGIILPSIAAVVIMYLFVILSATYGWEVKVPAIGTPIVTWVLILLVYTFFSTLLPVWVLLQPRDYINGHQLYFGLAFVFLAVIIGTFTAGGLPVVAPAVRWSPEGAPPIIPFLFVTIACGAISGFHSIVSSGTTSKQLDKETDARPVGYLGSLGEGSLALVAILACAAGFATVAAWDQHYASWGAAKGLGAKVGAFVNGIGYFLNQAFGISPIIGATFAAVVVVSFAATTMDTGVRLQKYVTAEFGDMLGLPVLKVGWVATVIAVLTTGLLALYDGQGKGGLIIWPLFGTTNQLLASLALLVISVFLTKLRRPTVYTLTPMVFLLIVTVWAMLFNLRNYWVKENWGLFIIGAIILISAVYMVVEAVRTIRGARRAEEVAVGAGG